MALFVDVEPWMERWDDTVDAIDVQQQGNRIFSSWVHQKLCDSAMFVSRIDCRWSLLSLGHTTMIEDLPTICLVDIYVACLVTFALRQHLLLFRKRFVSLQPACEQRVNWLRAWITFSGRSCWLYFWFLKRCLLPHSSTKVVHFISGTAVLIEEEGDRKPIEKKFLHRSGMF